MENKPKMILELDEYNRLIESSTKDSKMAKCLMSFLSKCMVVGGDTLLFKLQDAMTEAGYTIIYKGYVGDITFGKGENEIIINHNSEVLNA